MEIVRPKKGWKKYEESPIYKNENSLRSYQLEGLNWLNYCWYNKQNSILADEMGLGKTVQSVVFLEHLFAKENVTGPFLIVTPLSTIGNWEREITNWTDMNVVVYHGRDFARNLIYETEFYYRDETGAPIPKTYKFDIILTTYEMAMAGSAHLRPVDWKCVIVDEAHRLKNKSSKVSELLKTFKMQHRVLLTGTPLQNSLDELWALLNFLEPEQFNSERDFKENFGSLSTAADVERLQTLLKPLMLRRLKEDVEKSIPVKEETIVEVELTNIQKKYYRSILEKNFSWLKQGATRGNVPNLINAMIELRKCCIHPFLIRGAEEQIMEEYGASNPSQQYEALIQASGKMVLIDKLLKKLKDGGHKVLIFSQMTKCLDLIQDYLRGRGWGYERIDGGVRGELRQAAIDRFSSPESTSFVFLLCTRAGGVGINLTAADTCIIFDSDWNPQNDLQAQSRCHRIGQKKAVQIYRLVMRGTYEREMFDRASMKLGLDKAVLQRMDAGGLETYDRARPPSSLSKTEIEGLLKKGAYGAFMDDEASKQFCEEDIDQILMRRTQVIRHDASESQKGSTFSKASFTSANATDVDINDPDFWDKVREEAKLEVVEPLGPNDHLIIDAPRQRRSANRFNGLDDDDAASGGYGDGDDIWKQPNAPLSKSDSPRTWAIVERGRLERHLMSFGFDNFEAGLEKFGRRSLQDLKACGRYLLIYAMQKCQTAEDELVQDAKSALAIYPDPFLQLDEISETNTENSEGKESKDVKDVHILRDEPYPGATKKQIIEYRSFFIEGPADYIEHIEKRSKNILIRISMLFQIRHKVKPEPGMTIPPVSGTPPAPWWGTDEDRDLLISVCKHGYQNYEKMKLDPELCFYKRIYGNYINNSTASSADEIEPSAGENAHSESGDQNNLSKGDDDNTQPENTAIPSNHHSEGKDANEDVDQMATEPEDADSIMDIDVNNEDRIATDATEPNPEMDTNASELNHEPSSLQDAIVFPSASELGVRLRKLLTAFNRIFANAIREEAKKVLNLANKAKAKTEIPPNRRFAKDGLVLTKRDKFGKSRLCNILDFQKCLVSFGVPTAVGDSYDWQKFRELSGLSKNDDLLEDYYEKLMLMCSEVIERTETTIHQFNSDGLDGENGYSELASKELISAAKIIVDRDGETLTYDKAKKIMKRIEVMRRLREDVLKLPDLSEKLDSLLRPSISGSLPQWYLPEHDYPLLHAVAKWGLLRGDLIIQDKSFPFYDIHMEHLKSTGLDKESGVLPHDLVAGKMEDRFWIRDHALLKRIEYFCDQLGKKITKRGPRRTKKRAVQWTPIDTESDEEFISQPTTSASGLKLKLKLNLSKEALDSESKILAKQERRKKRKEEKESTKKYEDLDPISDDTDVMLEDVENRLSRTRSRTQSICSNSNEADEGSSSNIPTPSLIPSPLTEAATADDEIKIPPPSSSRSFTSIASIVNEDSLDSINILGKRDPSQMYSEEDVKRLKLQELNKD